MKLESIRQQRARKAQRPERSLMWGDPRKKSRYSAPPRRTHKQCTRREHNGHTRARISAHGRGRKFNQSPSRRH